MNVNIKIPLRNVIDVKKQWMLMSIKCIRRSRTVRLLNSLHRWPDVHFVIMILREEKKDLDSILCNRNAQPDDQSFNTINIFHYIRSIILNIVHC